MSASEVAPDPGLTDETLSDEPITILDRVNLFRESHPTFSTIAESAGVYYTNKMIAKLAARQGVELGHGRRDDPRRAHFIDQHPVVSGGLIVGVAPVLEEFAFRKLPSDKLNEKGREDAAWDVGTLVGLAFMAIHAGKDARPIPKLVSGLNYWRLQRERGYRHSVIGHVTNNALAAADYIRQKD